MSTVLTSETSSSLHYRGLVSSRSANPTCVDLASSESFARLYETNIAFVWRALRRHGITGAEVEDLAQEVFLVAHRRWADFEHRSSTRTWLYGICRRVASKHRRTAWRRSRRRRALACSPPPCAPDERTLAHRYLVSQLDDFLASLDGRRRDVFVLGEIEQLSGSEIAAALGVPANTVYSRLRSARRAFEVRFGPLPRQREVLVEAGRTEAPSSETQRRIYAALVPWLAVPDAPAPSGPTSSTSAWIALGSVASAALVAGLLALRVPVSGHVPALPNAAVIAAAPERMVLVPDGSDARLVPAPAPVVFGPDEPPPVIEPTPATSAVTPPMFGPDAAASPRPRRATPRPVVASPAAAPPSSPSPVTAPTPPSPRAAEPKPPPHREPTPEAEPPDTPARPTTRPKADPTARASGHDIAAELDLLQRARGALAAGHLDEAHHQLRQHARRFRRGAFAPERETMLVQIACRRGQYAAARARARKLERNGDPVVVERILRECVGPRE